MADFVFQVLIRLGVMLPVLLVVSRSSGTS